MNTLNQSNMAAPGTPLYLEPAASAPIADAVATVPADGIAIRDFHELAFPINAADGFPITRLELKRLKGRDMRGLDINKSDGKFGGLLKFVAAMNGLPDDALDDLDAVDVLELTSKAAPFLARTTGGTPSP